jgi:hypothetical protein
MKECKVKIVLNDLPKKVNNALTLTLQDRFNTPSTAISYALYESGYEVSERTIDRHRAGTCICRYNKGEN